MENVSKRNKRKTKIKLSNILISIMLVMFAVMIIYPLLWMVISSFKEYNEIYNDVWGLPKTWLVENYSIAWEKGIAGYFMNSVIVTVITIICVVFISSLCAYALSRFKSRLIDIGLLFVMFGMMVNPQVCLIPLYSMLNNLNLLDTLVALILPYVAFRLPLSILLIRSYFLSIPDEIGESALVDGCSEFKIYSKIYLPMSKPILTTVTLLTAFYSWNEFLFAVIFISSEANKTIPSGLMNFKDALLTNWGVLLAGMVIASVPMVILLIVFQKQLVRGFSDGSVKG